MDELSLKLRNAVTRTRNQLKLLRLIRLRREISQADLSRSLEVPPSSISNLVAELKTKGLVCAVGKGQSGARGGKRSELLALNAAHAVFSGLVVTKDSLLIGDVDFQGNVLALRERPIDIYSSRDVIRSIVKELNRNRSRYTSAMGVGIAVQSVVNSYGDVTISPGVDWEIPDFKNQIKSQIPALSLVVENDANCVALYARDFFGEKYADLAAFLVRFSPFSIGSGIIIEGNLFRGHGGAAGEIWRQNTRLFEYFRSRKRSYVSEVARDKRMPALLRDIRQWVCTTSTLLDTEAIVLSGDFGCLGEHVLSDFVRELDKTCPRYSVEVLPVDNPALLGAAELAIRSYLNSLLDGGI